MPAALLQIVEDAFQNMGKKWGTRRRAPYPSFALLRTLKAKGEAYELSDKSRDKSRDKVLRLIKKQPDITQAELALAIGLSVKGIEKIIRQLKDANAIRRVGGKKMGSWEVVAQ